MFTRCSSSCCCFCSREHFRQVDGLSNKYWGWGLEDDEFYARLKEAKLEIFRPGNLTSGIKDTFR